MFARYYAGGGDSIGKSFSLLNFDNKYFIGLDWGGGYTSQYDEPRYNGQLDYLFVSHAHLDHYMQVPRLYSKYGSKLKMFATKETIDLCEIGWSQSINLAIKKKRYPLPFTHEDANQARNAIKPIVVGREEGITLAPDLSVFPISSGHILGSISLLIVYKNEIYFLTSDICFQDRHFIKGAPKLQMEKSRLLVRESTYINKPFEEREEVISNFVKKSNDILSDGGKILVPALSVDRTQDIYAVAKSAGIPVYLDGSRQVTDVYAKYLGPEASFLRTARRFEDYSQREEFLRDNKPAMIIASSGMVHEGSLSSYWAKNLMPNNKNAIFSVNYQDPDGGGAKIMSTQRDKFLVFGGGIVRRACSIESFNFSAHMSGDDGVEMENRMNPETIIYNHGSCKEIQKHISNAPKNCHRVVAKAKMWVEV